MWEIASLVSASIPTNTYWSPNSAGSSLLNTLLVLKHVGPDFIDLDSLGANVAYSFIQEPSAGIADAQQDAHHSLVLNTYYASGSPNAVSFDQGTDNLDLLI